MIGGEGSRNTFGFNAKTTLMTSHEPYPQDILLELQTPQYVKVKFHRQ